MEDLKTCIENIRRMANSRLADDVELLNSSKYKLQALETIYSRQGVPTTVFNSLNVKLSAQLTQVACGELHPIDCIANVISILKEGLRNTGLLRSSTGGSTATSQPVTSTGTITSSLPSVPPSVVSSDHPSTPSVGPSVCSDEPVSTGRKLKKLSTDDSSSVEGYPELKKARKVIKTFGGSKKKKPPVPPVEQPSDDADSVSTSNKPADDGESTYSAVASVPASEKTDEEAGSSADTDSRPKRAAALKNSYCQPTTSSAPNASKKSANSTDKSKKTLSTRKIRELEKFLRKVSKKIIELQGEDMSLEDMDSKKSPYVLQGRLENKFWTVYTRLCRAHGQLPLTGRKTERILTYNSSAHPQVNEEITKFLRTRKFPDFVDIRLCIVQANDTHNLGLDRIEIDETAKKAFLMIGRHIKKRRLKDLKLNFGNHYTDMAAPGEDPALQHPELHEKLKRQSEIGRQRLDELIEQYAQRQSEEVDADEQKDGDEEQANDADEREDEDEDEEEEESDDSESSIEEILIEPDDDDSNQIEAAASTSEVSTT